MLTADTEGLQWESIVWRSATQYGSCKMWSHTLRISCQISEYDTCWHLVRHKHKLLSPHTNVKHPSSWIHARAPAESRINDASLPSPVTTNLRGWLPSGICDATLPPWGEFEVVAAGLRCPIQHSSRNTVQRKAVKSSETYIFILSVNVSTERVTLKHHQSCPALLMSFKPFGSKKWVRFTALGQNVYGSAINNYHNDPCQVWFSLSWTLKQINIKFRWCDAIDIVEISI